MKQKGKIAQWKVDEVEQLAKTIKEHPVVGIVDMTGFPAKQMLTMRKLLKNKATVKMSKKSLIQRALEKAEKKELAEHLEGQPALLFTKENPFSISQLLIENKATAPARENAVAPKDIIVPAGETSFAPGPIVGELQKAGLSAAIERGKVVIREESLIAKAGERIDKKKADIINKLGLEPLELKLNLIAAWENGLVYGAEALGITTAQVMEWLKSAAVEVLNLTYNIKYPTKYTAKLFVQKAFTSAKAVALKADYMCEATAKELLAKADAQAKALKGNVPEKDEEEKEETKADEKPPEKAEDKAEQPKEATEKTEEKKEEKTTQTSEKQPREQKQE